MTDPLIHMVRLFSEEIQSDRTPRDIFDHGQGEMIELEAEIAKAEQGLPPGDDGVVGESIDVILCKLDLIFRTEPGITDQRILEIATAKCVKWAQGVKRQQAEAGSGKTA